MKLSVKTVVVSQVLCVLASPGAASRCQTNQIYKGGDLLSMDASYETFMMSQLEYWSTTGQAPGLVATKDNIYKSFFSCTSDEQLVLEHWCACGIVDDVNATTGVKTGEKCVLPCSTANSAEGGSSDAESKAVGSSIPVVMTAVGTAAVLFAAGLL